jgi:hypothetical protein
MHQFSFTSGFNDAKRRFCFQRRFIEHSVRKRNHYKEKEEVLTSKSRKEEKKTRKSREEKNNFKLHLLQKGIPTAVSHGGRKIV